MANEHLEQQPPYAPNNEVKTSAEFFQKLGTYKIDALTNKQDKGEYWQFDVPVDDGDDNSKGDTFTIKKTLFEQIIKEQETGEKTASSMGQLREETQITVEMRQKTRELEVGTLVDAELKKPLWNTYEGYIKSLEVLAKDFEKIQEISDKAKRINEAGKETLKHVETTAKARKKHLEGVIVNVKRAQTGMNLSNDEPVGPIHEANFLEIFGEYLALKNDLKHGIHGKSSQESRKPNDSKKEIKRNTKELKKHLKEQQEITTLLVQQEILKIADDNADLIEQLLREMLDGKMDAAHQGYYQLLFHWIGQHSANYPFMYKSIIDRAKTHPQFANQIGYAVVSPGHSSSRGGAAGVSPIVYAGGGNGLDVSNLDIGETFTQGGAKGLIRKVFDAFPNLTEAQKDTWSNVGFAALLGVGIWQAGKRLFSKKTGGFWTKTLTIGGALLGSQVLFGESLPSLLHKIAVGGISFKELGDRMLHSLSFQEKDTKKYAEDTRLISCFGSLTPAAITTQMKERKKNPQSRILFLEQSDPGNAQVLVTKFGNPVKVKELEKWLAAIGVGFPVVSHLANEPMSKIRNYQRVNYQILESWLAKNGKKAKVGTREKINQIVTREASLTPAEIEKMDQEGLFERDEYVLSSVEQQQLATIKQQIEELDLTSAQKTTLTEVTESFYKTPSKSTRPQFGFKKGEAGKAILTHGTQEILIDINQFSLPHFNAGKAFTTRWDCLNTAYVAAYILEQKKHTPSQNPTPFSHNLARKGIVFDDAEVMSWNLDTRVLSTGWFGSSKEVSREVGEHPEAFAEYLNVLWQQKNLTPETFETLPDPAQTKDQIKQLELSDTDAFLVQKACNEIYATYGEEAQTLGIHLKKEGEHLIFTSYGKEIRLHLTTKTLEGFVTEGNKIITFGNLAEQIKAANFINVIKYHAKQMTALANPIEHGTPKYAIHPFYIDSYGNLMFRGTGENTTVATGIHRSFNRLPGLNNAIEANSPTLNAHKEVFVSYLNKQEPPFWSRYTQ